MSVCLVPAFLRALQVVLFHLYLFPIPTLSAQTSADELRESTSIPTNGKFLYQNLYFTALWEKNQRAHQARRSLSD